MEKHYAVVGVLEDVNVTLTVLENYIPQFFEGATELYWGKCQKIIYYININKQKKQKKMNNKI